MRHVFETNAHGVLGLLKAFQFMESDTRNACNLDDEEYAAMQSVLAQLDRASALEIKARQQVEAV